MMCFYQIVNSCCLTLNVFCWGSESARLRHQHLHYILNLLESRLLHLCTLSYPWSVMHLQLLWCTRCVLVFVTILIGAISDRIFLPTIFFSFFLEFYLLILLWSLISQDKRRDTWCPGKVTREAAGEVCKLLQNLTCTQDRIIYHVLTVIFQLQFN